MCPLGLGVSLEGARNSKNSSEYGEFWLNLPNAKCGSVFIDMSSAKEFVQFLLL